MHLHSSNYLNKFKKLSDKYGEAINFRLYYDNKPTNLIWYDEKIIFIPNEFFELKNLVNINTSQNYTCSLFPSEIKLINELQKNIDNLLLESNLDELISRIKLSGITFDNEESDVSVELLTNTDYSKLSEPIYLGNDKWLNL